MKSKTLTLLIVFTLSTLHLGNTPAIADENSADITSNKPEEVDEIAVFEEQPQAEMNTPLSRSVEQTETGAISPQSTENSVPKKDNSTPPSSFQEVELKATQEPAPNDAKNKTVGAAALTAPKKYYVKPTTSAAVLGEWPKDTIVGFIPWDAKGEWYTASIGKTTIFFTSNNMDVLPHHDATDQKAYTGYTAGRVNYYEHPSVNSKVLGSWRDATEIGYLKWDQSGTWYWATMGSKRVFFQAPLIYSKASSTQVFSGLSLKEVPYYKGPRTSTSLVGTFPEKTPLGFVQYDKTNTWYTATMGKLGRVFFQAQDIETLPTNDAMDKKARVGVAGSDMTYYQAPSVNAKPLGSFTAGTTLGYVHWDRYGKWLWATMGKQIIYFKSEGLAQWPTQNATDKKVYAGYALNNVPYYDAPLETISNKKVFKKGTYLGFLHYDAKGVWGWATMGSKKVYFPLKDVAKVPRVKSQDNRAYSGKTTKALTYYEAPTTLSAAVGTWPKDTKLGFVKYDDAGTWYWAYMGSQKIYFLANGVKAEREAGQKTAYDVLGLSKSSLVSYLEKKEKSSYFLGTPFPHDPYIGEFNNVHPNGDPRSDGYTGMNCTGFLVSAIDRAGGKTNQIRSFSTNRMGKTSASAWQRYFNNQGVRVKRYHSIDALIKDGKASKGDIIFFEPRSWSQQYADTHIGFFWGNSPSDNKYWHSDRRGNRISEITTRSKPYYVYLYY